MKKLNYLLPAIALVCLRLPAQRSWAGEFDDKKPTKITGVVTKWEWNNPEVFAFVDVTDKGGAVTNYPVEFADTLDLKQMGWTRDSVKVGDTVTVDGAMARDGSKLIGGKTLTLANGKKLSAVLNLTVPPPPKASGKPAPKWPDGHPRLGPEPGQKGYWTNPSVGGLYETKAGNIRMNKDGLLANIADAPKVAPMQPWALGLYEYRQKNFLRDDPIVSCLPPSGPRQFMAPHGFQFVEQPDRQRIFVMSGGGNRNWRLIYLDGRPIPTSDDVSPTYFGYSTGKWEGDTLVVNVGLFTERFWFTNGGLPHTEALKLTERFSRPDYNILKYEVTVDDPGAYTRPWTGSWELSWAAGQDLQEYFCQDNDLDPPHMTDRTAK